MDINSISNSLRSVITTLESNPIIPLIVSGGFTVWLISNIKGIFTTIKNILMALISFEIFNTYEDNRINGYSMRVRQLIFNDLITKSTTLWERTMNLDLSTREKFWSGEKREDVYLFSDKSERNLTYGFSIKILFGKIVLCNRHYNNSNQKITVNTNLRIFFSRKRKFMERLDSYISKELNDIVEKEKDRTMLNVFYGTEQSGSCSRKNKRLIDSVFTNNNEHKELLGDIKKFLRNKETYKKLNYPYKYSALLEGVPGSGKSSTILAIASELNRDVEYINLSTMSVQSMMSKLNNNTDDKIFVFEDIDALNSMTNENRESENNGNTINQTCVIKNNYSIKVLSMSLSDLLNITDGLLSSDGSICLFTTNHAERLDPALLRAGRMNKIVKFEYMNPKTANSMIKNYLGFEMENLKDEIKPVELQEEILNISLGVKDKSVLSKFCK